MAELIDLVNSVTIFLSQMTLNRWLTFLLGYLSVTLRVHLFWIYFFILTLVLVLKRLSLFWEILIILLSRFPLTFLQTLKGITFSWHSVWLFSCWLGRSSRSFVWCSMGSSLVLLLLVLNSGSWPGWNWCTYPTSGQASPISMVLSCLYRCHSS